MILTCNSCEKRFVVPDQAISAKGRLVQCGSCGNKWKQFPLKKQPQKIEVNKQANAEKITPIKKLSKTKKKGVRKTREIDLYSPEYLAKKHGISLKDISNNSKPKSTYKTSFGFYNYLILFLVLIIAFSKGLYFLQDFIIQKIPSSEFYLNYFFESMRNMFEIWKNLISNY